MYVLVSSLRWMRAVDIDCFSIDDHSHPSIQRELSAKLGDTTSVHLASTSSPVAVSIVVGPSVPSCLTNAIAIHLNDVHLHARWFELTLDVAVVRGLEVTWIRGHQVEVIVDASMCTRSVHVELDVATQQIEGLPAMDTSTTCHIPSSLAIPVRILAFNGKVVFGGTIQLAGNDSGQRKEVGTLHK